MKDGSVDLPDDAPLPRAVLSSFGLPGRVTDMVPVPGAWSNRLYRLTTDRGAYAVKQMLNPWRDPLWRDWLEAAWQFEQLAWRAGVSMPEPISNPADGGCLAWVSSASSMSRVPVRVHVWVDGTTPGSGPVNLGVAQWAGETLAALHRLDVKAVNRERFPVMTTDTADRWPELVEAAEAAGAAWAAQLRGVLAAVRQIADLARAGGDRFREEVMTHGDIDQKNLVLTAHGPVLCDWDVAAPLIPRRELADVALSLAGWERCDVASGVVRAYRGSGGVDTSIGPEDLGQTLMRGLDWIAFNVERAIGARPATPAEAALGAGLVPGLVAEVPRQVEIARQVHRILDG